MVVRKRSSACWILNLFLMIILLASCNLINPAEPIPAYIKIDSLNVTTDYPVQGTASNKIKDVWVYMDDSKLIGVYQLPALFPVIGDAGNHTFSFLPGIYDNGIANTHIIYRLMKGYATNLNLVPGETVAIATTPTINYFPGVSFKWLEDFEDGTISLTPISGDTLIQDNTDVFEGSFSGKIRMDANHSSFRFEMFEGVTVPIESVTYLEMNYKCDYPFYVGLIGRKSNGTAERQIIVVKSTDNTWNKIYISLGDAVRSLSPSLDYKIYVSSTLGDATAATFHFDNFKLLHN